MLRIMIIMKKKKSKKNVEEINVNLNEELKKQIKQIKNNTEKWYFDNTEELDAEGAEIFDNVVSILEHIDNIFDGISKQNKRYRDENLTLAISIDNLETNEELTIKQIKILEEIAETSKKDREFILEENEKIGKQTKQYLSIIDYALKELPEHTRNKIIKELENTYSIGHINVDVSGTTSGTTSATTATAEMVVLDATTATVATVSDLFISDTTWDMEIKETVDQLVTEVATLKQQFISPLLLINRCYVKINFSSYGGLSSPLKGIQLQVSNDLNGEFIASGFSDTNGDFQFSINTDNCDYNLEIQYMDGYGKIDIHNFLANRGSTFSKHTPLYISIVI